MRNVTGPHLAAGWGPGQCHDAAPLDFSGANFEDEGEVESPTMEDSRWRELFPLPPAHVPDVWPGVSTSIRRRKARVRDRAREVNEIMDCLNDMYQPSKQGYIPEKESLAQRTSAHFIHKQLCRMKRPSKPCTEREAIQELLQSTVAYSGDENVCSVRSYERDLVSLPTCGTNPIPLHEVLDPIGREFIEDPFNSMLLSEDEWGEMQEQHRGFRPYMDEVLQHDSNKYHQFTKDLFERGMVDFCDDPDDLITPFFCA